VYRNDADVAFLASGSNHRYEDSLPFRPEDLNRESHSVADSIRAPNWSFVSLLLQLLPPLRALYYRG
jgi:hypothetical protein